jgi:hypothetical protein
MSTRCSPEENQSPDKRIAAVKSEDGSRGKALVWHAISPDAYGVVNFSRAFPTEPGQVAAGSYYALCYVASPDDRRIKFRVGSEAPIRVWVNEAPLDQSPTRTWSWRYAPEVVPCNLKRGLNKVLVKVSCTAPSHNGFCFRTDGSPEDRASALDCRGLWEESAALYAQANDKAASPANFLLHAQVAATVFATKGRGDQGVLQRYADRFAFVRDADTAFSAACNMVRSIDFDAKSVPLLSLAEMGRTLKHSKDD